MEQIASNIRGVKNVYIFGECNVIFSTTEHGECNRVFSTTERSSPPPPSLYAHAHTYPPSIKSTLRFKETANNKPDQYRQPVKHPPTVTETVSEYIIPATTCDVALLILVSLRGAVSRAP